MAHIRHTSRIAMIVITWLWYNGKNDERSSVIGNKISDTHMRARISTSSIARREIILQYTYVRTHMYIHLYYIYI